MRILNSSLALVICLAMIMSASVFAQGLYWESTTTGEGATQISKMFYMPKMFKIVTNQAEYVLLRLDREMFYTVHPGEKTYSEMSFADMEKTMKGAGARMDKAMEQMREQMKDMPEEQRKQVEQMMGGMMKGKEKGTKAPVEVIKTSERKTVSGRGCTKYILRRGDEVIATLWVTKEVKEFEAMSKDFAEFSRRMMAMNPATTDAAEGWDKIDGFPMETEHSKGIKTVVTKIEKQSVPVSDFEVPKGYKKVKSKMAELEEEE
ncbi:MAG: DUF4412 domain-containing protein [Ignavibacteria bacterium]|nr:DUF4412 domain-containing protein [Ignavibacteria bacterium]